MEATAETAKMVQYGIYFVLSMRREPHMYDWGIYIPTLVDPNYPARNPTRLMTNQGFLYHIVQEPDRAYIDAPGEHWHFEIRNTGILMTSAYLLTALQVGTTTKEDFEAGRIKDLVCGNELLKKHGEPAWRYTNRTWALKALEKLRRNGVVQFNRGGTREIGDEAEEIAEAVLDYFRLRGIRKQEGDGCEVRISKYSS